ncbi:MAG: Rrf2 family transcriptional regulator [Lentisphaerae bacterium]|jgi:Rrf2 family protein|nr:Rrf2 family transcriptional regulator [Lentisphaerota bacterium]
MTISTKGRYGLRLLIDVAIHQKGGVVNLKSIAERQKVSVKYLWQVANPLKAAGILRVTRGARGGFLLAKDPKEVTLFDIISILEGSSSLTECVDHRACANTSSCAAHIIWIRMSEILVASMREITLAEAVEIQEALGVSQPPCK